MEITIHEALSKAKEILHKNQREENVAALLLMHHLECSRAKLLSDLQMKLPQAILEVYFSGINEHALSGVPIQHIIGYEMFFGRKFVVNEHVLIPRPETEELVCQMLERAKVLSTAEALTIADIGAGSGCIAITMQLELPSVKVIAVDISPAAIQVARENALNLGANKVQFLQGNLVEPLIASGMKVDVLLSNPPYIPLGDRESLQDVVRNYDPELALFGGEDGLDLYREMIPMLPQVLSSEAVVGLEIGSGQGEAVAGMLQQALIGSKVEIVNDINGRERMVFASVNG